MSHAQFIMRLPSPLRLGQRPSTGSGSHRGAVVAPVLRHDAPTPVRRVLGAGAVRPRGAAVTRVAAQRRARPGHRDGVDSGDALTVNRVGEVGLEFHDLHQGLSYGLQWSFDPRED